MTPDFSSGTWSLGSLNQVYQPMAQLKDSYFRATSGAVCQPCGPGCVSCSGFFGCTECSSGQLLGGICIAQTVQPEGGTAGETLLTFSEADFASLNFHINEHSNLARSTQQAYVAGVSVLYPNGQEVALASTSNMTIPTYNVVGVEAFSVQVRLQAFLQSGVQLLALQDYALAQPAPTNTCGCAKASQCGAATGLCECGSAALGAHCQFTAAQVSSLQAQTASTVSNVQTSFSLGSLTPAQALDALIVATVEPAALTDASASQVVSTVEQVVSAASSQSELSAALNALSNILGLAGQAADTALAESIEALTSQMAGFSLAAGQDIKVESSKIAMTVASIDTASATSFAPADSSSLRVTLPANFAPAGTIIVSVLYQDALHQNTVSDPLLLQATASLSLRAYSGQTELDISNLTEEVEFAFPVSSANPVLREGTRAIAEGRAALSNVQCVFFNENSKRADSAGCRTVAVTASTITCACRHFTSFMGFLNTGLDVLRGSNYGLLLALSQLNAQNLKTNLGLYLAIGFWGSFLCLALLLHAVDRKQLAKNFHQLLFEQVKGEQEAISVKVHAKVSVDERLGSLSAPP